MPSEHLSKIALFGGSFDPIHLGHIEIARAAQAACDLDRVVFLPCWQSPHKSEATIASAAQRLEMLELATRDLPWAEVSKWELERDRPSYSWMTAEHFAQAHPRAELFWILGTDQWRTLERWAEPEKLAELLTFVVFPRGEDPVANEFFRHFPIDVRHPASSTEIRHRLATGLDVSAMLAPEVADYIAAEKLYQEPTSQQSLPEPGRTPSAG